MSMPNHPRDKKDRSVRARKHDRYIAKGKLQEPSVCRECQAVYHKGRWVWGAVPSDSQEVMCPACERIRDHAPSGVLLLTGEFVVKHRNQVLGLARNEEVRRRPNILWLELSRSRTKPKHPKGWSSPRPIPIWRGASARHCIMPIAAHWPVVIGE